MKHHPIATANAAALTIGVVYLVCAVSVILLPELVFSIARTWFHGISMSPLSNTNINLNSFIFGLVTSSLAGWLVGYLFAYFYNMFIKK